MGRAVDALSFEHKYGSWNTRDITPSSLKKVREMYEELYKPEQHSSLHLLRRKSFSKKFQF